MREAKPYTLSTSLKNYLLECGNAIICNTRYEVNTTGWRCRVTYKSFRNSISSLNNKNNRLYNQYKFYHAIPGESIQKHRAP